MMTKKDKARNTTLIAKGKFKESLAKRLAVTRWRPLEISTR